MQGNLQQKMIKIVEEANFRLQNLPQDWQSIHLQIGGKFLRRWNADMADGGTLVVISGFEYYLKSGRIWKLSVVVALDERQTMTTRRATDDETQRAMRLLSSVVTWKECYAHTSRESNDVRFFSEFHWLMFVNEIL